MPCTYGNVFSHVLREKQRRACKGFRSKIGTIKREAKILRNSESKRDKSVIRCIGRTLKCVKIFSRQNYFHNPGVGFIRAIMEIYTCTRISIYTSRPVIRTPQTTHYICIAWYSNVGLIGNWFINAGTVLER